VQRSGPCVDCRFLALGKNALLTWRLIDEPVLPFAALAVIADRCVERASLPRRRFMSTTSCSVTPSRLAITTPGRAASPSSSAEILLLALQVEEQLFLIGCGAYLHQRPRAQDVFWIAALIHHIA
jgi:hypothetical protein